MIGQWVSVYSGERRRKKERKVGVVVMKIRKGGEVVLEGKRCEVERSRFKRTKREI